MSTLFFAIGWLVVILFAATSTLAILALIGKVQMPPSFLKVLVGKVLIEGVGAALFLLHAGAHEGEPYDISGTWSYALTTQTNTIHGYCTITRDDKLGDITWTMSGVRLWHQDNQGQPEHYSQPLPWHSAWAHVIDKADFKFSTSVLSDTGYIKGLGECKVLATASKATEISGEFNQMIPGGALAGNIRFLRIKCPEDADCQPGK
ncbi:exported hypothetical protein [Verrucomicrobia bacterium]|nr:exported hypothetical protein [Verrucomicrobiota bacterium]